MGSGLGKRKVISGVLQEISIRTNFVHFVSQWSGKKKRPCSQGIASALVSVFRGVAGHEKQEVMQANAEVFIQDVQTDEQLSC